MINEQALIAKYFLGDFENVTFETESDALSAATAMAIVLDIFTMPHQLTEADVVDGFECLVGKWVIRRCNGTQRGRH